MAKDANHWQSYWRERSQGDAGALAQDAVHADPGLDALWRTFFAAPAASNRILDVGCGEGSVLRVAQEVSGDLLLFGVDLSEQALADLSASLPNASPVCSLSQQLPFPDGAFGSVVSQYGVEYGGAAAFADAARLVAPQGRLLFVVHYSGGSICKEAEVIIEELDMLNEGPGFISASREFFSSIFAIERDGVPQKEGVERFHRAQAAFQPLLQSALRVGAAQPESLSGRLSSTVKTFFEARARYDASDILGWLDEMAQAMDSSSARTRSLLHAALDKEGVQSIASLLSDAGLDLAPVKALTLEDQSLPGAWVVAGSRP